MRVGGVSVLVGMLATVLVSGTVHAANESPVRADLDGKPIRASEISSHYCHDHAYPQVHCFSTASELEAALISTDAAIAAAFGPNDYVTVYSEPTYGGSYMHLSQNYDTLFWIGWSDRISSIKARNSNRGTFWSDWYGAGQRTDFCCNQTVPYFSSAVDNTFSSVYRG